MWETVLYRKVLTDSMILNIEEGSEGLQLTWKISQRRDFGCNWSNSGLDLGPTTLQTSPILALPAPPIIRVNAASRGEEREGLKGDKGVLEYQSDSQAQNSFGWETTTATHTTKY